MIGSEASTGVAALGMAYPETPGWRLWFRALCIYTLLLYSGHAASFEK